MTEPEPQQAVTAAHDGLDAYPVSVGMLVAQPDITLQLISRHVPDDRTNCAYCSVPASLVRWPCDLRRRADQALRRMHDASRRSAP